MISNLSKSKIKNQICIYCGIRKATERDHVPPECFFPIPRPSNLITVPSCAECNRSFGKHDERVRNLITSSENTEQHDAIKSQLAHKRNRSIFRERGITNLNHLMESIIIKDRYSEEGLYLGTSPAFNLDQPLVDRFFDRMTRALFYHENAIGYVDCYIKWYMAPSFPDENMMPDDLKRFLSSCVVFRSIGDDIFTYGGWFNSGEARSIWFLNFYDGVEFMTILSENKSNGK